MERKKISELEQYNGSANGFMVPGVADGETQKADLGAMVDQAAGAAGYLKPSGLKTINGESVAGSGDLNVAVMNPLKGTFLDTDTLPTTGQDGEYIYVVNTSVTPRTANVYAWNGTAFADTGKSVEDFGLQFASGQAVNTVHIKDENGSDVTSDSDVFCADSGMELNLGLNGGYRVTEKEDYNVNNLPSSITGVLTVESGWKWKYISSGAGSAAFIPVSEIMGGNDRPTHIKVTAPEGNVPSHVAMLKQVLPAETKTESALRSAYIADNGSVSSTNVSRPFHYIVGGKTSIIEIPANCTHIYVKKSNTAYNVATPASITFFKGSYVNGLAEKVGDVTHLETTNKTSLVAAVNELKSDMQVIEKVGVEYTKTDATIIRATTGTESATDNPNGVRLRVILYVKKDTNLLATTSDTGGMFIGVFTSIGKAVRAASDDGMLQQLTDGYVSETVNKKFTTNGYLSISLTNGTTPITDERKQQMIDSLNFTVSSGLFHDVESLASEMKAINDKEIAPFSYYGQKFTLNGYNYKVYSTNSHIAIQQSAANWQDYLFIVGEQMEKVACYNLKTKQLLYTLTTGITAETFWHCNQASFGKHYYDNNDMFPVLYVSMQNNNDGRCSALGYRIIPTISNGEITSFSIALVQTIFLPVMTDENCLGNTNITFDLQSGYMWGYGRNNRTQASNYLVARFTKFNIPNLFDENQNIISEVTLSDSDILDSFSDNWSMLAAQGGFIRNGKLVIMQGSQGYGYIYCRVIDLYTQKKCITLFDLLSNGFTQEPQGVFYYDGHIMTQTSSGRIFQLNID